jgi:hypothetical protein
MSIKLTDKFVAYLIVFLGFGLAFAGSITPHFGTGHRLDVPQLILGAIPYCIYGVLTPYLRGLQLIGLGVAVLVIHGLMLF